MSFVASPGAVAVVTPVVVVGLLVEGIDMNYNLLSDPTSPAYITDESTGEIIGTPYLDGVTGTGFM